MRLAYLCLPIVLLPAAAPIVAQTGDSERVLIRNVRMIDRSGQAEDAVVSIRLAGGKLELVTQDELPIEDVSLAVDAENGILLGKLIVGEPPTFIILSDDPRENFDVLLDSATYVRFAVHDGVVVKNTLPNLSEDISPPEKPKRGWMAYTPPPLMMPSSYLDETKWNKWETRWVDGLFAAAVILDRQHWVTQDEASEGQVGDLEDFDGGEVRGVRFGAVGTINFKRRWVYTVFAATNAFDRGFDADRDDDLTFFDYRLDIPLSDKFTFSVGKQKEPISMERIMSLAYLPMQERSAVSDAILPSRNFGVVGSGVRFNQRMTWAIGLFNDFAVTSDSLSNSATQWVGRLTGLPFITEDESNLIHLGFGVRRSDAREGAFSQTEPEFNMSPIFVDTGVMEAERFITYNLEASWRRGPLWLAAEAISASVDAAPLDDPTFGGFHVTASWALTREMRAYNKKSGILGRLPVSRSVYQGGWGAWEIGSRWSTVDLTDGLIDGGEMDILSVGMNWWLSPFFHFSFNYRQIELDQLGAEGDSGGFATRVMLFLE